MCRARGRNIEHQKEEQKEEGVLRLTKAIRRSMKVWKGGRLEERLRLGRALRKIEVLRKKKDARMRPSDRAGLLEECGFK